MEHRHDYAGAHGVNSQHDRHEHISEMRRVAKIKATVTPEIDKKTSALASTAMRAATDGHH
eukprot:scaffold119756_cov18-Prasinocladus_malaysianus.AAC.1